MAAATTTAASESKQRQQQQQGSADRRPPSALALAFSRRLEQRDARHLRRKLTLPSRTSHDFSSNDFLSLSTSPVFRQRLLEHLGSISPSSPSPSRSLHPQGLASGGSRLLDGNSSLAESLERSIARFHDAESALLFNSGYDANLGIFSCIPQPGDVVLYDALIHASIHDGMRLSRAGSCRPFPHNDPQGLREMLVRIVAEDEKVRKGERNVFVAVESVYSMDGDVCPVDKIADVVEEILPRGNGYITVDEAHATGVFGPKGAGVVQSLNQQRRVFIRLHTFGKAMAAHGAVVLCSEQTRDYLINYARSLIYTTALPLPALASIRTAYEILDSEESVKLRANLSYLIEYCHRSLFSIGGRAGHIQAEDDRHDLPMVAIRHEPSSPIFSLVTPLALELADFCQKRGFMVRAVRPPTVPKGTERVRLCLHAGNTTDAIDGFAAAVKAWIQKEDRVEARL